MRVSVFRDDALTDYDAVGVAELISAGKISPQEAAAAAVARVQSVDPALHAVAFEAFEAPRFAAEPGAPLYGVPTFIKDSRDVADMPSNHGSGAFTARPAQRDGRFTRQFLSTGVTVLGKSRLPEFAFNASTEFAEGEPNAPRHS